MNRAAKLGKKSSPESELLDPKISSKKKPIPSPRNPLKDLNSSSSSNSTSSMSVEAPRGCLSFFLSNSSSKTPLQKPKSLPKTPKSAPNPRPSKPRSKHPTKNPEKVTSQAKKTTPCLNQWQNGKKPSSRAPLPHPKPSPVSEEPVQKQQQQWSMSSMMIDTGELPERRLISFEKAGLDDNDNGTPVNKLAFGSVLDFTPGKEAMEENSTTTTTTPPVQASISPEIQCGSSLSSTTPACFGAGHVLSGITDKRKCRPRGMLTVGEDLGFSKPRISNGADDDDSVLGSLPTEASMHWILSPCKEEEDQKGSPRNGSPEFRRLVGPTPFHSPSSPSSGHGFSSDICDNSNSTSSNTRRTCLISPSGLPEFEGFPGTTPPAFQISPSSDHLVSCSTSNHKAVISKEERGYRYDLAAENSPFSGDSLGSQNVICTPQSDSSLDRHIGLSWLKNEEVHQENRFELNSMADVLRTISLSPQSQISMWDHPADVLPLPGLSFQFSHPTTPSNFIDQIQLQKTFTDWTSGISSSNFGNSSQSQMRISWREGLVSRIFEMDELDYCRWLSDEEEDVVCCGNHQFKSNLGCELDLDMENDQTLANDFMSSESVSEEPGIDREIQAKLPSQVSNSCSESISTEGGGLIASGDSDWTLCYKNKLFEL